MLWWQCVDHPTGDLTLGREKFSEPAIGWAQMNALNDGDILTRVRRYNLIREQRMIYIDVHETLAGNLAGKFVAVPNLVNIVAKQEYQGVGETEAAALEDCLKKIRNVGLMDLFPEKKSP